MAKQAKAEKTVEVAPQPVVTKKPQAPAKPSWEIKDRLYQLKQGKSPLVFHPKTSLALLLSAKV